MSFTQYKPVFLSLSAPSLGARFTSQEKRDERIPGQGREADRKGALGLLIEGWSLPQAL